MTLFERTMESIIRSIKAAGYDPHDQLMGYIQTGDATYITRTGNARQEILALDMEQVKVYFEKHFHRWIDPLAFYKIFCYNTRVSIS